MSGVGSVGKVGRFGEDKKAGRMFQVLLEGVNSLLLNYGPTAQEIYLIFKICKDFCH